MKKHSFATFVTLMILTSASAQVVQKPVLIYDCAKLISQADYTKKYFSDFKVKVFFQQFKYRGELQFHLSAIKKGSSPQYDRSYTELHKQNFSEFSDIQHDHLEFSYVDSDRDQYGPVGYFMFGNTFKGNISLDKNEQGVILQITSRATDLLEKRKLYDVTLACEQIVKGEE